MISFKDKKNILWDFDGVLVDSMKIRTQGFVNVLFDFPKQEVKELLDYHKKNGGLSRYAKFRYFFEGIRKVQVQEKEIQELARKYSRIMRKKMLEKPILIEDSLSFVEKNFDNFQMHLVSGSDGEELLFLSEKLKISKYFKSIEGSPTPKIELVKNILLKNDYELPETMLIGDSMNDYQAARSNNVQFFGYNNKFLEEKGLSYIKAFI